VLSRPTEGTQSQVTADQNYVAFDHVDFSYGEGERALPVVSDVSFSVARGTFTAIVGPSGCGKTTILNIIAGLSRPTAGSVTIRPHGASYSAAYMLARDALLPWRSARKNVELPMEINHVSRRSRQQRAAELLTQVGLAGFEDKKPIELSHGMRQRVALARTLAQDPDILLMDEPFSALDAQTRVVIQRLFLRIWERERKTVFFVTHDLTEALALADRVIVLSSRPARIKRIVEPDLPRPRQIAALRHDETYNALYDELWSTLETEVEG
jgi:NitT/TauT family transport system ATP-binding protein